jgi:hypothetical protein
MPCTDGGPIWTTNPEERTNHGLKVDELAAILCGFLSSFNWVDENFDRVDWDEVGISKQKAKKWWKNHKAADEKRRVAEQRMAERKKAADRARIAAEQKMAEQKEAEEILRKQVSEKIDKVGLTIEEFKALRKILDEDTLK